MLTVLLLILILALLGVLPAWPYSHAWGYYPSGGLGILLIIVIVLMLLWGRRHEWSHTPALPVKDAFLAEIPYRVVHYGQLSVVVVGCVNLLDLRLRKI
jgi:hypothetical protein